MRFEAPVTPAATDFITVKVAQVPGQVREIALNGPANRTLANALTAYGTPLNDRMEISVNGTVVASGDYGRVRLDNNDVVTITQKLKGAN